MSKATGGLSQFITRGRQSTALEDPPTTEVVAAGVPTEQPQSHARARAQKSVVAMSFRINRQDWERLHQLAITEGVSINTLTLRGLSKLFEERGLPGMTI